MRFYFFDGTAAKGPYSTEELSALPGFDAESVVCPVGAENREDWKPAIAYEPLKNILFKPLPLPTLSRPPAPTQPCPQCSHRNEMDAVFCNQCGLRMAGEPAAPAAEAPRAVETPMPSPGETPAPAAKISPAEMVNLSTAPRLPLPILPPLPVERPWKTYAAAGAAVLAAFYVFFIWLGPKKKTAGPPKPPAASAPALAAPVPPAPEPAAPKPAASAPLKPTSEQRRRSRQEVPAKPKISRKPPTPAPPPEPAPAPAAPPQEPKPEPQAAPKAAEGLLLPGMPAKIQRPPAPSVEAEKLSLDNAREQFDFCHHLMLQKAHGDVFDTCLCRNARKAAPFNGSRDLYIKMSEEAAASEAGKPRPSFEIVSAYLQDATTAVITAAWKAGKKDKGHQAAETWLLEDGLWCLQP